MERSRKHTTSKFFIFKICFPKFWFLKNFVFFFSNSRFGRSQICSTAFWNSTQLLMNLSPLLMLPSNRAFIWPWSYKYLEIPLKIAWRTSKWYSKGFKFYVFNNILINRLFLKIILNSWEKSLEWLGHQTRQKCQNQSKYKNWFYTAIYCRVGLGIWFFGIPNLDPGDSGSGFFRLDPESPENPEIPRIRIGIWKSRKNPEEKIPKKKS